MNNRSKVLLSIFIVGMMIAPLSTPINSQNLLQGYTDYSYQNPNNPDITGHWDPVSTTGLDNSIYLSLYGTDIVATSSLAFLGATWSANHRWQFGYELVGTGYSGNPDLIQRASIYISEGTNNDHLYFYPGTDSADIGSSPESGSTNTNYENIAFAAAGVAISLLNSYFASVVWSVASFIDSLIPTVDSVTDTGTNHVRSWSWYPLENRVGEFFHFYFEVDPNYTTTFEYQYVIFGPYYEALSAGLGSRTLVSGAAGNFSSLNPELMSEEELRENKIIAIPIDQLPSKHKELNISESTVKELIDSGAKYCYYTTNIEEYENSANPNNIDILDDESFINLVNRMINRSEIIIDSFSNSNEEWKEYNDGIIKKHQEMIQDYNNLIVQTQVNNLSEEDRLYWYDKIKIEGNGWF